ncbi:glycoside hydrolase [Acephala macrosclerotiorum]|nr:glycoside hydrolase [Acephala macrosclerotiorum]
MAVALLDLSSRQSRTTITVDVSKKYQTMDGFGFSEAFQRANVIVELPEKQQKEVLDIMFNATSGAGMTLLRIGIGSSPDSSSDHMNTIKPKNSGSPTAKLNHVWDGIDSGQLFVAAEAYARSVQTFYADAWSAPRIVKINGNENNGGSLCGVSGANASYAGILLFGTQAADFIKILSPTIKAANLSTGIACCDSEGWSNQRSMTSQIKSAGVESLLSIIASHSYTSSPGSPISTSKRVWQTENVDLQGAWQPAWYASGGAGEGMHWTSLIHTAVVNTNCSAYLYWVGVQGGSTNSKMSGHLLSGPRGATPGSVRVGASDGGSGLQTSAYLREDGSVAILIINTGTSAASMNIGGFTVTSVKAYVADNTHDYDATDATVSARAVTGSVPGRLMVTLCWRSNRRFVVRRLFPCFT